MTHRARTLAGLKSRTLTAIGRAMPKHLLMEYVGEEWHEEIVMSVYEAMKALERDTRRRAIQTCAGLAQKPYSDAVAALGYEEPLAVGKKIARAIRRLDKPTSRPRLRVRRTGRDG